MSDLAQLAILEQIKVAIEQLAETSPLSATALLELIKTVDGTGSGLDADTLKGRDDYLHPNDNIGGVYDGFTIGGFSVIASTTGYGLIANNAYHDGTQWIATGNNPLLLTFRPTTQSVRLYKWDTGAFDSGSDIATLDDIPTAQTGTFTVTTGNYNPIKRIISQGDLKHIYIVTQASERTVGQLSNGFYPANTVYAITTDLNTGNHHELTISTSGTVSTSEGEAIVYPAYLEIQATYL